MKSYETGLCKAKLPSLTHYQHSYAADGGMHTLMLSCDPLVNIEPVRFYITILNNCNRAGIAIR